MYNEKLLLSRVYIPLFDFFIHFLKNNKFQQLTVYFPNEIKIFIKIFPTSTLTEFQESNFHISSINDPTL